MKSKRRDAVGMMLYAAASFAGLASSSAFELQMNGLTCGGHEWLSTQAARAVGVEERYLSSLEFGARYVDLGGMTLSKDWLFGHMKERVHRGPGVSHHHFCLRGGASDLDSLIKDAAARIRYLLEQAVATKDAAKVKLVDGGLLLQTRHEAFARYVLVGAALHTIQDSFAHGYRTPVIGKLGRATAANRLRDWGGANGDTFRKRGLYLRIQKAVLVPEPATGTLKHNEAYSEKDGSPHKSDRIFNATLCQTVASQLGNLQPHAFAAYLASRDFVAIFRAAAVGKSYRGELDAFMARWFTNAAGKFPGYGVEYGKCASRAACNRALIPGEPGYVIAPTVVEQVGAKTRQVVKDVGQKAKDTGKKAIQGGKKLLKKLGF